MVEMAFTDGNKKCIVNVPESVSRSLSPELRKQEMLDAVLHLPLCPILYAASIFFSEADNRIGARELSKSGLLRALGIILNSPNLYEKSLDHYAKARGYLDLRHYRKASTLLNKVDVQTALMPGSFFELLNSGEKIEAMELNERNPTTKRFHHRIVYKGEVFVTDTETGVYEL
ncbi:hypothetical protein A3K73_07385 [Candidatus Pacearchaeota archaeon RBG_13_36_9]|nr:MAG: hypothetical protein A3K73_07385 [Candidatus Pacearchaeota archaeon RBG_13_36_9]